MIQRKSVQIVPDLFQKKQLAFGGFYLFIKRQLGWKTDRFQQAFQAFHWYVFTPHA